MKYLLLVFIHILGLSWFAYPSLKFTNTLTILVNYLDSAHWSLTGTVQRGGIKFGGAILRESTEPEDLGQQFGALD